MANKTYVLDCETTGISNNPETGRPDIIELGYFELKQESFFDKQFNVVKNYNDEEIVYHLLDYVVGSQDNIPTGIVKRFKPQLAIHPEAYKTHGIKFVDLIQQPPSKKALSYVPNDMLYMVGHKVDFDYRCIGKPEKIKTICTERLARKLKKYNVIKVDNVQLDTLVKHFYPNHINNLISEYHSALGDCVKTTLILIKFLQLLPTIESIEDLYKFQEVVK
jgi:DNA polymerase III epsilon subunit-like protein